jgi:hypothetical protein
VLPEDELRQLEEIDEWFRQRGYVLSFDVDPDGWRFVAVVMKDGVRVGADVPWGTGSTQLEAAEEAREEFLASFSEVTSKVEMPFESGASHGISAAGGIASEETFSIPGVERDRLEKVASEFGWYIGFVREPDGRFRWFVFDENREPLKHGIATEWDDALLQAITDIYPPSGET